MTYILFYGEDTNGLLFITVYIAGCPSLALQRCVWSTLMGWSQVYGQRHSKSKIKEVSLQAKLLSLSVYLPVALPLELTRKNISEMFFRGEVEEELRECPLQLEKVRFKADSDMEEFMISVE